MTGAGDLLPPAARREAAAMAVLRAAREHGYTVSRTKLAKLLYLADLRAVEARGDPVSGVTWKWLDYGPFNTVMYDVERALTLSGWASKKKVLDDAGVPECRLELVDDRGQRLPERDEEVVAETVAELGNWAASTLRNASYQTVPMLEAQEDGDRGVDLDLWLVRPLPKIGRALRRLREVARDLPDQFDDEGVEEDLAREFDELRPARARANRLIGDP